MGATSAGRRGVGRRLSTRLPVAPQSRTELIAVPAGADHPEECHD